MKRSGRLAIAVTVSAALWLTVVTSAQAAIYYVDALAGNDGNAGNSETAAWKNAPGMDSYTGSGTLAAGDTVYFHSARTWAVTGSQGIYLTGGVAYVGNAWGTGTRATLLANSDLASAVVRFRDHQTRPTVFQGFDVNANGKVANGIEMNHSFYAGPLTGAMKRIDSSIVRNVWSRTSLGQYRYGISVSNHGGTAGEVANVEILNTVVHDISRDGLVLYPGDENANCIIRNIVVRGNTVFNTGKDPDYGAGAGIIVKGRVIDATIENNYVTATKGAGLFVNSNESNHFGYGPANIHIRNNIVNVDTVHGSIRVYDGSSGSDPKDLKIYGNIVLNNPNAGLLLDSDVGGSNQIRIYNNTFFKAPVRIQNTSATFPVLEFKNNVIYSPAAVPMIENGRLTAHSNNVYFGGSTLVASAGRNHTAATLGAYEPSASSLDPNFRDVSALPDGFTGRFGVDMLPNKSGLSLSPGSVGIDRGAALGIAFGASVNGVSRPAGAAWDIGAYEAGDAVVRLPAPQNLRIVE